MSEKRKSKIAPHPFTPRSIAALLEITFITVSEASAAHFYAPRTIRQWCDEGRIEAYKWGGSWMIVSDSIANYCRQRRD